MIHERWTEVDINAYLDGRLAPERLAIFEKALVQSSALRQRVDALRKTIALLRETPLRESPRNYLLTPSMVVSTKPARSPRQRSIGMMRLATSLTAAAFILTMGLNVLSRGPAPGALMEQGESLMVRQTDEVIVQEVEAPVMMMAAVTPTLESALPQEKALAVEEPAVEPESEISPPAEEMKTAPVAEVEAEEPLGIGAGGEQPAALEAPQSPEDIEEGVGPDAAETVEPEQVLMGEAADTERELEAVPDEGDNVKPMEDNGGAEAVMVAPPAEERAVIPPGAERDEDAPLGMWRLARIAPPRWVPISLGIMTLLLLGVTLILSTRHH